MDYAMARARTMPWLESDHTCTPSPVNPLGVKGVGEAGTIGSTPAMVNSVVDALSPLGIRHVDMPLTPEKLWQLISKSHVGRTPTSAERLLAARPHVGPSPAKEAKQ